VNRYIAFGITILVGLIASLYFAWMGGTANVSDAEPNLLREDFRADYALMVAESFHANNDAEAAIAHLAFLDAESPITPVEEAIAFGQDAGFSENDLALLDNLADALVVFNPDFAPTPTP
jgi:hypothetical protein